MGAVYSHHLFVLSLPILQKGNRKCRGHAKSVKNTILISHFIHPRCQCSPHLELLAEYGDPVLQCHLLARVTMMGGWGGGDPQRRRQSSQGLLQPKNLLWQLCYLHKDKTRKFGRLMGASISEPSKLSPCGPSPWPGPGIPGCPCGAPGCGWIWPVVRPAAAAPWPAGTPRPAAHSY